MRPLTLFLNYSCNLSMLLSRQTPLPMCSMMTEILRYVHCYLLQIPHRRRTPHSQSPSTCFCVWVYMWECVCSPLICNYDMAIYICVCFFPGFRFILHLCHAKSQWVLSYVSVSVPSCKTDTKHTVAYEYSDTNVHIYTHTHAPHSFLFLSHPSEKELCCSSTSLCGRL